MEPAPGPTEQRPNASDASGEDRASAFECNICFDTANEPVVTLCGHLFCWSCLYKA